MNETGTRPASAEATPDPLTADQMMVVDIGKKQKKGRIRRLRKGRGRLFAKLQGLIGDLREEGSINDGAQVVVVVVERKKRRFRL